MYTLFHWIGLLSLIVFLTGCSAPTTTYPTQALSVSSTVASLPADTTDTPKVSNVAPSSVISAIETDQVVTSAPVFRKIKTPESPTTREDAQSPYLDNRSDPVMTLCSMFNAIARKEYDRAYSYWQNPGASPDLQSFEIFQQDNKDTVSIVAIFGSVVSGASAGQIYYNVPAALKVQTTGGKIKTSVGCYTLQLTQSTLQTTLPSESLGIRSASVKQVANEADLSALLAASCQNVP